MGVYAMTQEQILEFLDYKMPFGKYKDRLLIDLPEYYVVWFKNKGFPPGKLGQMMALCYEIKLNGLEDMFRKIKKI